MNYEDEPYVRLYTRDTVTWMYLGWEAQALFTLLLRKVDRVGALDVSEDLDRTKGALATFLGMPLDLVAPALDKLLETRTIEKIGSRLLVPNFVEAQSALKSGKERQRESRKRRRDMLRAGMDPAMRGAVIYFVQGSEGGPIKIGRADDLAKRVAGLETGRPDKLIVLAAFSGTLADERQLHSLLAPHRLKGEWFADSPGVMMAVNYASQHGSEVIDWLSSHEPGATTPVTPRDESHEPETPGDQPAVTSHASVSPVTPSLAKPNRTEIPLTPLPDPKRRACKSSAQRCEEAFSGEAPKYRADVQQLHAAWKTAVGLPGAQLVGGPHCPDAEILAAAIDAYGLDSCLKVAAAAPEDGMVSGARDDKREPHKSVKYIFGNTDTFNRILHSEQSTEAPTRRKRSALEIKRDGIRVQADPANDPKGFKASEAPS